MIEELARRFFAELEKGLPEGDRGASHRAPMMSVAAFQLFCELKDCVKSPTPVKFFIGQRVIVGDEIGIVQRGPTMVKGPPGHDTSFDRREGYVWVHLPSKGYASDFAIHNVQPLPGGQL